MKAKLTVEAKRDVLDAVDYYGEVRNRFGQTFDQAFEEAIRSLLRNPDAGTLFGKKFRRIRLNRFPYGILYLQTEDDLLLVTAVMHLRRHPDAWNARSKRQ